MKLLAYTALIATASAAACGEAGAADCADGAKKFCGLKTGANAVE